MRRRVAAAQGLFLTLLYINLHAPRRMENKETEKEGGGVNSVTKIPSGVVSQLCNYETLRFIVI